jgi:hypothetical protein
MGEASGLQNLSVSTHHFRQGYGQSCDDFQFISQEDESGTRRVEKERGAAVIRPGFES